jgi:hypothetical protein
MLTFRVNDVTPPKEALTKLPAVNKLVNAATALVDDGGVSEHAPLLAKSLVEHAFLDAILIAFNDHRSLALKPSHFWLMVIQGVALHVSAHSEALRTKWVMHEGKKTLTVRRDGFVLGQRNDWGGVVPDFISQIRDNTVTGVVDMLTPPFSNTTPNEAVATGITVMDVLQKYFDYECMTCCGFPSISLIGTHDDWHTLARASIALIRQQCLPELSDKWVPALESVYERILKAVDGGDVDVPFWQSMCKRGGTTGSGAMSWVNGWINVFLPYTKRSALNSYCVSYRPDNGYVLEGLQEKYYGMCAKGTCPGISQYALPSGLSTVPVKWIYFDKEIPLEFKSGFIGVSEDDEHRICPEVGWFVQKQGIEPASNENF